jgi:glutamate synthase (NADPH/NADH)
MSLAATVGPEGNLLEMNPAQCRRLLLASPVLSIEEMNALKHLKVAHSDWPSITLDITFDKDEGLPGYRSALDRVCKEALTAVEAGFKVIILSDRATGPQRVPLSALLATGGVHHYLVAQKKRTAVALMVDTAEAREVHHVCVLVGYGADAICPYLMMEIIQKVDNEGLSDGVSASEMINNYRKATDNGILKVMSKMGISTLQSYKGAQIFEALGIHHEVIAQCFVGTASRVEGATFELLAMDAFEFHERGWPSRDTVRVPGMPESGEYHWRAGGEPHINDPTGIANLQDAVREKNPNAYEAYSKNAREAIRHTTLRGMLEFDYEKATPIPIDQVEPWNEIVRRFAT